MKSSQPIFPSVDQADEQGLLAYGGELSVHFLENAYRHGIFPWPQVGLPILWFAPPQRGILDFQDFHLPSRFLREIKNKNWEFKIDHDFQSVICECAKQKRKRQKGTWILPEMILAYIDFHEAGFAHSFEVYEKGRLIGGLYGVWLGDYFAGESMFHLETGVSKFALMKTVEYLKKKGLTWMDTQMVTPLLKSFGGKEIPRKEFMERLNK
ncbi:MAG: leucyl/phenylalanyl-tRNA--protein transferase [Deltaproteobacteria bacterium]|nr:MAG: leucyl/phenylalanyl-tRNA--protein transferase [Deltaproteobacteria bacterium]